MKKEYILIDNDLFRELYGVEICEKDEIKTLKNITKAAMDSEVCKLPCVMNFFDLDHMPGMSFQNSLLLILYINH